MYDCECVSPNTVALSQTTVTRKGDGKNVTYWSCHATMLLNSALFRKNYWRTVLCDIMTSFPFPCNKVKHLRKKKKKKPTSISNSLCFAAKIDCDESNSPNQLCSMVLSEEKNSTYVPLQNIYSIYLYVQTA